ncbi:retrovirus-related pol polyprotein from transposon TNT 1-94, partial [Tanacetum coccineum]
ASSQTEKVPQGKKPGAKSGLRRKQSSKNTSESQTKASKSKIGQSDKETQSSSAKNKSPSHPSPSTLVVGEMHKEAQQAASGPTSLGATSEEGTHPQLSSGMDEGTQNYSLDLKLTRTNPSVLVDKTKSAGNGLKTAHTDSDEPIIVSDESEEEEEVDKDKHTHATSHDKDELEQQKEKAEAEVTSLKSRPSYPDIKQLTDLQVSSLKPEFSKLLASHDFASCLPTELKDLPSKFTELSGEIKELKKHVKDMEIELPGDLKEIPTKLENFTLLSPALPPRFATVVENASGATTKDVPSTSQATTLPVKGEKNTNPATTNAELNLHDELIDLLGIDVVTQYYNKKLLYDKYCDKMLKKRKSSKITNCDVFTQKDPISLKVHREDGTNEVISNVKVSDIHLAEWREVVQACPDRKEKGWKTIYGLIKTRMECLDQTKKELKIDFNKPLKEQDPLNELNDLANKMILASVEKVPLVWPSITVDGVTRLKEYELTPAEAIQADCDIKAINIILQGLPTKIYLLVESTSFMLTLEQPERHANEVRLMHERNSDPLALVASHQITQSPYQTHQHTYQNTQLQPPASTYPSPQYGSPYQSQQYSTHQSSTPLSVTYPSNDFQSSIHHNVYSSSSSIPQLEYPPQINQQFKFSQQDSGLIVLVFQKGDDPIDAINHMMSFLTAVVTSGYPTTNNQLKNSSNPRQQATINNGRVTLQPIQGRQTFFVADTSTTYTPGASGSNSGKQGRFICYTQREIQIFLKVKATQTVLSHNAVNITTDDFGCITLKDLFSTFNQHLVDELSEVQKVFYQMEQAVEQHRIESKTFEEKALAITTLKDELRKLKGKSLVDNNVLNHPSDPELHQVNVEPITPKLLNKRTAHSAYIKHSQEEAAVLRDLVDHIKANYPLDPLLKSTLKQSTSASGSQPSGNTKKDKIQQTPSSTLKNKVEAHPRKVKSSLKNKDCVVAPKGTAHVQHSKLNANYELKCVKCNGCMLSDNHDLCVLDFINNVNARAKSRSVKKNSKRKIWKPTGKVFTNIGYIWRPICVDHPAPEVVVPINEVIAPVLADSTGLPSSTIVDQDAPSPIAHMGNDPYFGVLIPEIPSNQSSSSGSIHTIVHPDHQISEHNSKWTKDHPLENIIGELARPVSTRLQLHEQALFCYYDAFLTAVEPKTYKDALTQACWIEAMQEELNEFERLEVWELVPRPDKVMVITLKWIYKVKLDELGGILKNKAR